MPKILSWDIESTSFNANKGIILCVGYKWLHEKKSHIITVRGKHPKPGEKFLSEKKFLQLDKEVVKEFVKVLKQADLHTYWFGSYFDIKFLRTRNLLLGLPDFVPPKDIDVIKILWKHYKFSNNKLDTISEALAHFKGAPKESKTKFSAYLWHAAAFGDEKALKMIEDHCRIDVKLLEFLYLKFRESLINHPNIATIRASKQGLTAKEIRNVGIICKWCGHSNFILKGSLHSQATFKKICFCKSCKKHFLITKTQYEKYLKLKMEKSLNG